MQTVDEQIVKFDANDKSTYTGKNLIHAYFENGKPVIRVYDMVIRYYLKFHSIKQFLDHIGIDSLRRKDMHKYWKDIGNELGISAKEAHRWYEAIAYKTFVASVDNWHVKKFALCPIRRKVKPNYLSVINEMQKELDQVKTDNIYNIAPFVFHLKKNPQELRQHFGKGTWKALCKNSFRKNDLIRHYFGWFEYTATQRLNSLPSSVLLALKDTNLALDVMEWVAKNCKGKYTDRNYIKDAALTVRDTIRIGNELNENVSMNWDYARFRQEHDRLVRLSYDRRRAQYYGNIHAANLFATPKLVNDDAIFAGADKLISIQEVDSDKVYTAVPLVRHSELIEEGSRMRHCVASYARYCAADQYAVYSIRIDGKPYSTLGLQKYGKRYVFEQHRAVCNQEVKDEIAIKIASKILRELNKDVDTEATVPYDDRLDAMRMVLR